MVIDKKTPFVFPSDNELYLVSLTIYLHNKLQAIDVDKEVSKEINYYFYHAPSWQLKGHFHVTINEDGL